MCNDTHFTCYTILGMAKEEKDRLYAKAQWMPFSLQLDNFFTSQALYASVVSYQSQFRIKKIDKKGNWHVTGKNAPTGGVQKWSEKANQKVCGGQLETHLELLAELAKQQISLQQYIESNFPEIDHYFYFNESQVYAYLDPSVNVKHQPPGDFHCYLRNSLDPNNNAWSQEINILFSQQLLEKSKEAVEKMIKAIAPICHAVHIAKADFCATKLIKTEYGAEATLGIFGKRFGQSNSLLLQTDKDLQLSEWLALEI